MKMNIPRYEFRKENKALLAEFLKKSEEYKSNKFCNLQEHDRLTNILPVNEHLKELLIEEVVDITQSDGDISEGHSENLQALDISIEDVFNAPESSQRILNETTIDDITYAIKENLETEKCLSASVIGTLHKSDLNLEDVFLNLSNELNYEEVLNLGLSLNSALIGDDRIISHFIKYLLLKQLAVEFSDQFQSIYNEFCQRYSNILMEELTNVILNTKTDYTRVFLQYLNESETNFKSKLFRNFIFNCTTLQDNHIPLIEALHGTSDIDSLNKLVEIMSMSANNYSTNKPFGKLLLNVIKVLGKNIQTLERPMNHIIATHKSVWKGKIQKQYKENLQDSILMSQSFRY
ncbi:unnamed protein product [Phaedon cochleariae]|uniref:Uncharacterized protein n=1 Tax=Phaedon cochleariae TaxID=80249 RepID=A0A9P0DTR0_PHACE|nr:unnamed protein product [Phaedon cochleariae]